MDIRKKEELIDELKQIREKGWVPNTRPGNSGGVGNTLEDLLGIEENNLPISNTNEWELKAQRIGTSSLITLFHMEPSPRAANFVSKIFLPRYSWPHQKAGIKYSPSEMSFRQTINARERCDRGFCIVVDRVANQIRVSFDATTVTEKHVGWLESVDQRIGLQELNPQPYWGFDDLQNKAGSKLLNCLYVRAQSKREGNKEFFHYTEIKILEGFNIDGLLKGLEEGVIYVDFDARTGHNHGTKFRLHQNKLPLLYKNVIEV